MFSDQIRRIRQVIHYGWLHANKISREAHEGHSVFKSFFDILHCYRIYGMWSNQYMSEKMYSLSKEERRAIGEKYYSRNQAREQWLKEFTANRRFLAKYSKFEIETSLSRRDERNKAYSKQYHTGKGLFVEYGVMITNQHFLKGELIIKDHVMIARDADLDYSGDLTIGNNVSISEGAKILTHTHDIRRKMQVKSGSELNQTHHSAFATPLLIDDYAWVGSKAVIMPGVQEIGRGAVVSACAVVTHNVPPYAIVQGNPAQVIGFCFPPKIVVEKEKALYPPEQRIPLEVLQANFDKFFKK